MLNNEGLKVFRQQNSEEASNLENFVSTIKEQLYQGKNCTIWIENDTILDVFNQLTEYKAFRENELVSLGDILCDILDVYVSMMGVKNIIVDSNFERSNNWVYANCEVWIMTANYFFTTLFLAVQSRYTSTKQLEAFAKANGFSFDVQEVGGKENA